jgi:hypothetical protein
MRALLLVVFVTAHAGLWAQPAKNRINQLINDANYAEALQEIESQIIQVNSAGLPPLVLQNKKAQVQILLGRLEQAEATLDQIVA